MKSIKTDRDWEEMERLLILDGYRLVVEYVSKLKKELAETKKDLEWAKWGLDEGALRKKDHK